jgi:chromosome condensin MukBEF MukE localization factor
MVKFDFNRICKFKGKDIINLDKVKANCDLPFQFEMYDPVSMRVILLDEVNSFTLCVEPTENEKAIFERYNFELVNINDGFYMYKRKKNV